MVWFKEKQEQKPHRQLAEEEPLTGRPPPISLLSPRGRRHWATGAVATEHGTGAGQTRSGWNPVSDKCWWKWSELGASAEGIRREEERGSFGIAAFG